MTEVIFGGVLEPDDFELELGHLAAIMDWSEEGSHGNPELRKEDVPWEHAPIVIVPAPNTYLLVSQDERHAGVAYKFENMRQEAEKKTVSFTVYCYTRYEEDMPVVYVNDAQFWEKPTKEQCQVLVDLFPQISISVKVPEYHLTTETSLWRPDGSQ